MVGAERWGQPDPRRPSQNKVRQSWEVPGLGPACGGEGGTAGCLRRDLGLFVSPSAGAGHGGAWAVPQGCSAPSTRLLPLPELAHGGRACHPGIAWLQSSCAPRHTMPWRHVSPPSPCHLSPVTSCNGTLMAGPAPIPPGPNALCTAFSWDLALFWVMLGVFGGWGCLWQHPPQWSGLGGRALSRTGPSLSLSPFPRPLPPRVPGLAAAAVSGEGAALAWLPTSDTGWGEATPHQVPPPVGPVPMGRDAPGQPHEGVKAGAAARPCRLPR